MCIYIKEIERIIIFIGEIFANSKLLDIVFFFFFLFVRSKLFVFGSVGACKLN